MKRCSWCRRYLPTDQFWRKADTTTGLQHWCKECLRVWRQTNRELERPRDRERRQAKRVVAASPGDTGR